MANRQMKYLAILAAALIVPACTGRPPPRETTPDPSLATPQIIPAVTPLIPVTAGIFPIPPEIEPQVAFWRKVYGSWSRSQVVLHDNRYLNLIYEVVDLPGAIDEDYTPLQQELLRQRRSFWQARLGDLERKLASGGPLDSNDKGLAAHIAKNTVSDAALYGTGERLHAQRGLRERFKRGLEISGRYDRAMRNVFRQAGLPEDLAYLPHVESSFQASARSSAGAVGIWQFTLSAAHTFMNVNAALDERLDPVAAARGAARYLSYAYNKLGSWPLALTSYNHGIGGMQRAKDAFGHDFIRIVKHYDHPQFGFASRNFYAEFLAARQIASRPEQFFPEGIAYDKPLDWDRVILRTEVPVSVVARYYGAEKWQLIALNLAWTEAAKADRVPLPAGAEVWLPPGTLRRVAQDTASHSPLAQSTPRLASVAGVQKVNGSIRIK
jgi:membrane-bound lytic murein transglycosylase D